MGESRGPLRPADIEKAFDRYNDRIPGEVYYF